jgi:hypothetical protein
MMYYRINMAVSLDCDYVSVLVAAWRTTLGSDHISASDMDTPEHVYPHAGPRPTYAPFSATRPPLRMHAC